VCVCVCVCPECVCEKGSGGNEGRAGRELSALTACCKNLSLSRLLLAWRLHSLLPDGSRLRRLCDGWVGSPAMQMAFAGEAGVVQWGRCCTSGEKEAAACTSWNHSIIITISRSLRWQNFGKLYVRTTSDTTPSPVLYLFIVSSSQTLILYLFYNNMTLTTVDIPISPSCALSDVETGQY